jgi:hypothetical protein
LRRAGVDADPGGDAQGLAGHGLGIQLGVGGQGPRRGQGIGAPGADGHDAVVGLDHVAVAGHHQHALRVPHQQQGLQAPQGTVGAPLAGQLHGGAAHAGGVGFQLGLQALGQRQGVRGATRKAHQSPVTGRAAHLARLVLHHDVTHGDLAVGGHGDTPVAPDSNHGGGVQVADHPFPFARGWARS